MEQIIVKNLKKTYKVQIKNKWFKNKIIDIFSPKYKTITAVNDINFSVNSWEKVAFIWPNWAWKSTTIKLLCWILSKSSWEINILNLDPVKNRKKLVYQIWAVFGQTSKLWYHLTAYDTFLLFSKLYDIPKNEFETKLNELVNIFEISDFINNPVRKLSLWQRMKCEIIASLLHNPQILFLDEPTIWLDMIAKQKLRETINQINSTKNTTIFLTSHDIWDIEDICDRVIIINYWKIIYDWSILELKQNHIKTKIIDLKLSKYIADLQFPDFVKVLEYSKNHLSLEIENKKDQINSTLEFLNNSVDFEDISIKEPSLEEIIKTFY